MSRSGIKFNSRVEMPSIATQVFAVIVPCSNRKRIVPEARARAVSLPIATQSELETAWLERLAVLKRSVAAQALYSGRGALLGRQAARAASAPLYIASAGLGLVGAEVMVPAYGVTVANRGDDSVPARVSGRFDPSSWWSAVCKGPMSTTLDLLLSEAKGRVTLIALTEPYAAMLGPSLAALPDGVITCLRVFGWRLQKVLPSALHDSIIGYDARLEAVLPGTQVDFAQRAMAHFVDRVLPLGEGSSAQHRLRVSGLLSGLAFPHRVVRSRRSDAEIQEWLGRPEQAGGGVAGLLRRLRDMDIACEQSRFSRLYAEARKLTSEGGIQR